MPHTGWCLFKSGVWQLGQRHFGLPYLIVQTFPYLHFVVAQLGAFMTDEFIVRPNMNQWNFITTAGQSRGSFLIIEFTQQDGRKKRTAKLLCVTNVTGLLLMCLCWSWLKMFPGLLVLQKDLSIKGGRRSAKTFFKQNYCHACHTKFAVFFPLPSCSVSSLPQKKPLSELTLNLRYDKGSEILEAWLALVLGN